LHKFFNREEVPWVDLT
jgi:hypothetical protein